MLDFCAGICVYTCVNIYWAVLNKRTTEPCDENVKKVHDTNLFLN